MKRSRETYIFRSMQQLAPYRGASRSTGVVARAVVEPSRDIEALRGRMGESAWHLSLAGAVLSLSKHQRVV